MDEARERMSTMLIFAVLLLAVPLASAAEQLSSKECENLGFSGLALCSDCNTFAEYVKNQGPDGTEKPHVCLASLDGRALRDFEYHHLCAQDFNRPPELVSDCLKCCTEDSDDSMSKMSYSGAVLEVCMRKLVFYPEIVGFIEEEKDKFPSVRIQYMYNSPPKLIMLDDDGQHKENIRVDNWKREHILQFLREKLKPSSAAL